MQNTPPMHLNTSPASFEGSGTGKQEKQHKTLKNLKLAPKKQLGISSWCIHTSVLSYKCKQLNELRCLVLRA